MKRYLPGILLFGGAACTLYYMVSQAMSIALEITEKLQQQGDIPDLDAITRLIAEQSEIAQSTSMSIASTALLVIWVIGIVDAYRLGRLKEKNDRPAAT